MDTFPREEALGSGRFELYQVVLGIDSSGFRVHESLILLFLGTVSLLFLGTELLLVLGTVGFGSTRHDWLRLGSWIQWRRLLCNGEVTILILQQKTPARYNVHTTLNPPTTNTLSSLYTIQPDTEEVQIDIWVLPSKIM